MITVHVSPDDLVNMRFAYRPLMEIVLSRRVFVNPDFQSPHRRWLEEARRQLHEVDLPYLNALVAPKGYIPDFITQPPLSNRTSIEDDFADILATPDAIIRKDTLAMIEVHGDSAMRRYFLAHPREATMCLIEEMREYWRRTLAHHWSRMMSTLEGDVLYRARLLALEGPGPVFEDLHPTISYHPGSIHIQPVCQCHQHELDLQLNGDGLQLVPTIFRGCGRMFLVDPDWHSMLAYGVRGTGLWHDKPATQSLELAMGAGRARVLQAIITPATTGEVAFTARITAATASQHLSRLTKAGLVQPRRSGKRVYYHLTERGQKLIDLFEPIG